MIFEIIGEIEQIETMSVGGNIRDIMRLQKQYGPGRWRKVKGFAMVRLLSGRICKAELHWYEGHSGEDYLYPESYFVSIQLPREAQEALRVAEQPV